MLIEAMSLMVSSAGMGGKESEVDVTRRERSTARKYFPMDL
jgi:hypothetical protein